MAERLPPMYPPNAIEEFRYLMREGNVTYIYTMYAGDPNLIWKLAELAETPEFLAQYPNHHVCAIGEEVIAAMPLECADLEEWETNQAAYEGALLERGFTQWNCAVITTRRRGIAPDGGILLVPSLDPANQLV